MADQIITRRLCDFCQADDVETANAERMTVALNGTTYEIDVCAEHGKPLTELAATLAEHGRKLPTRNGRRSAAVQPSGDDVVTCPACGAKLSHRNSLQAHARQMHGKTLAELEGKPLNFACDVCGKRYNKASGLAQHRTVHDSESKPQTKRRQSRATT